MPLLTAPAKSSINNDSKKVEDLLAVNITSIGYRHTGQP